MIANKLELDIIRLYDNNFVNLFSINQISKLLNKKYPYINKKVTEMIREGILRKTVIGNSYLCSLNLKSKKAVVLMLLNEIGKQEKIKRQNKNIGSKKDIERINEFVKKNILSLSIISVVVSKGKFIFIVDDKRKRRVIFNEFENADVVDKEEFIDLLIYNKSLVEDHIVVYGIENFFELVSLALDELKREYSPIRY